MAETPFGAYAAYYDLLYGDKDYAEEAAFVARHIRAVAPAAASVLDLGCGTARHLAALAGHGFRVAGIDRSPEMIARARARFGAEAAETSFTVGDVRSARLERRFDAVTSLFHVVSYQLEESDLLATFATAAAHLAPGGAFLFDFWHGPAVLGERPSVRVKRIVQDGLRLTRIAEPVMDTTRNRVDVHYEIFAEEPPGTLAARFGEVHSMRYWFLPELRHLLAASGLRLASVVEWMSGAPAGESSWSVMITAVHAD